MIMSDNDGKDSVRKAIRKLCEDKTSGSTMLLRKINEFVRKMPSEDAQEYAETSGYLADCVLKAFQGMTLITELAHFILEEIKDKKDSKNLARKVEQYLDKLISEIDSSTEKIAKALSKVLKTGSTAITLSKSETVLEVLGILHQKGYVSKVIISESRPMNEGVLMSRLLAKEGIEVILVVDAALDLMVEHADCALIGADTVYADNSVLNKIGSRGLALSCRHSGRNFYVICQKRKLSNDSSHSFWEEEKPGEEITGPAMEGISVKNRYFEIIEPSLITGIFTEDGFMKN